MKAGLWPVVSDIGAPAERVRNSGFGTVYDRSATAVEICTALMNAAQSQVRLDSTANEALPAELPSYFELSVEV